MFNFHKKKLTKRPTLAKIQEMHAAYNTGLSFSEVGSRFGVSRQWVWIYFKQHGLKVRPYKRNEKGRCKIRQLEYQKNRRWLLKARMDKEIA